MKRLFVGIQISEEVRNKLIPLLQELNILRFNVVPPENLHFTLKFLGEVDESKIKEIEEKISIIASKYSNFEILFSNIGMFPSDSNPKVIWLGTNSKEMVKIMQNMDKELNYIRENEHTEEIPHLTLARIKIIKDLQKLNKILEKYTNINFGKMKVDKIVLFESILESNGPKYKVIKDFSLV